MPLKFPWSLWCEISEYILVLHSPVWGCTGRLEQLQELVLLSSYHYFHALLLNILVYCLIVEKYKTCSSFRKSISRYCYYSACKYCHEILTSVLRSLHWCFSRLVCLNSQDTQETHELMFRWTREWLWPQSITKSPGIFCLLSQALVWTQSLDRPPLWPPVNHNYHQCSHTCTLDQLSIPCTHLHSASTNSFAVMPGLTPSLPSHSSIMTLWAMCVWVWAERYLKGCQVIT